MPSLSLTEARTRAALVSDVHTEVELDVTGDADFGCRATLRFAATPGAETFLELAGGSDVVVTVNDQERPDCYDGERIRLGDLAASNTVTVAARLPYVTDGDGMHTMTDPADDQRYVCAYTAMDIAQRVLPCFDQPDLKTTFALSVVAPESWTVLGNGPLVEREGNRWTFEPTPPIASYLFFMCAGPWHSLTWTEEYQGREVPFGWHARASLAAELDRDFDELREITVRCFRHYTEAFDEPYPFADYQQVFTPGLNWGAMEFPGCVSFRDEYLFRGEPTALQRQGRAEVIAHEMAHMWFGDLVTMRWWEDSWLNESFADFMGYEVASRAAGFADSWVGAALQRKPTAYRADRRRSTHPIAEDAESLVDVDTAFGNFDMITYAKGNAVLRQLVTWLGEDDFLSGVNRHLSAHPFGNADLADFLAALDAATDRDVRGWAEAWLRTTGFDTIRVTRDGDVPVLVREGSRPHRLTVAAFDDELGLVESAVVDLADEPVALPQWAGRVVVPNSADETYARLVLDDRSKAALQGHLGAVADPLTRALLWSAAVDAAESGESSVADVVALAGAHLPGEAHPVVLEGALSAVARLVRMYAVPDEVESMQRTLADVAARALAGGDAAMVPAASRVLATSSTDVALLGDWLDGAASLPEPDQDVRWLVVRRLAALGQPERIDPETARDRSASGEQGALSARAAVPTGAAKQWAWERLFSGELSNRDFEAIARGFWGLEQTELTRPWLLRFAEDAVALGRRSGQAFGKVIPTAFPWLPLAPADGAALRDSLAAALDGDVPTVLRRSLEDTLDDLDRVLASR